MKVSLFSLSALVSIIQADLLMDNFFNMNDITLLPINVRSNLVFINIQSDDVTLGFYSSDFPETCNASLAFYKANNITLLPGEAPPKDFFEFK